MYTADDLIAAVQEAAGLPEDDERFTDAQLLKFADSETFAKVLPELKRHVSGFLSYDKDYTLVSAGRYRIPPRAVMSGLLDVKLVTGADEEGISINPIPEHEVRSRIASPGPLGFYVKNNSVYLLPKVPVGFDSVRLVYMLRPSELILLEDAAEVTAIDTVTSTVTCATVPTGFSSGRLDIIRAEPQAELLAMEQTTLAVVTGTAGTIQFSELPEDLEVGDYVAPAGYSPIVLLPREIIPLLEQLVANRCNQSQGDSAPLQAGLKNEKDVREGASILMTPRVQHAPKRLVPRHGIMRRR